MHQADLIRHFGSLGPAARFIGADRSTISRVDPIPLKHALLFERFTLGQLRVRWDAYHGDVPFAPRDVIELSQRYDQLGEHLRKYNPRIYPAWKRARNRHPAIRAGFTPRDSAVDDVVTALEHLGETIDRLRTNETHNKGTNDDE